VIFLLFVEAVESVHEERNSIVGLASSAPRRVNLSSPKIWELFVTLTSNVTRCLPIFILFTQHKGTCQWTTSPEKEVEAEDPYKKLELFFSLIKSIKRLWNEAYSLTLWNYFFRTNFKIIQYFFKKVLFLFLIVIFLKNVKFG